MAVKTTTTNRIRTEVVSFTDPVLADVLTQYNDAEATLAADTDKTWAMTPISFFFDGTNYNLVAYRFYPEATTDPLGQIPELP